MDHPPQEVPACYRCQRPAECAVRNGTIPLCRPCYLYIVEKAPRAG